MAINTSVLQHTVEVLILLSDDVETDDAFPGENLKLRLKGIEEEEILPGFILCSPDNLCHSGRTFDAQVRVLGRTPHRQSLLEGGTVVNVFRLKLNWRSCIWRGVWGWRVSLSIS